MQTSDNGFLNLAREAAARAKVHQTESGHIQPFGQSGKLNEFILQSGNRLRHTGFRGAIAVGQLADHGQKRHFPHDHLAPRAGQTNVQLAVIIGDGDLFRVIAELTQPVQIIRFKERQA